MFIYMNGERTNMPKGDVMDSMVDVRNLLKRFGVFIYTRSRRGDVELMELELAELHRLSLITQKEYLKATLILQREKRLLKEKDK